MNAEQSKTAAAALLGDIRAQGRLRNAKQACALLTTLRDHQAYDALIELAEAIGRVAPAEPTPRRLYAQALINTGRVTVALDVLEATRARLAPKHPEVFEVTGLLGRSYKQIYFDARNRGSKAAQAALAQAIAAYADGYRANPARNTWHGVNLLALVEHCRRTGLTYPKKFVPKALAKTLLAALAKIRKPVAWDLATIAEASLGTGDWSTISDALIAYTNAEDVTAFHIEATLRQFQEVWRLQDDPRGKPLLAVLTAFMMKMPDAKTEMSAKQMAQKVPDAGHFEATLGKIKGAETRAWWMAGLEQGKGVAAIRQKLAGRIGTGFLVRAKSVGLDALDENLVLTNFHVVNKNGVPIGLAPENVEIAFEAIDPDVRYEIAEVLCESPPEKCDFCLLRLTQPVKDAMPLTIGRALPALQVEPPQPQVFVIGHPQGKELTYSFQDNEIIDHEGPAAGKPPNPAACRVHYRAPTEKGNSGSPVFNSLWQVIALHHAGSKQMPRLNGKPGEQPANEGIWLQSIIEMIRGKMAPALEGAT